MSKKCHKKYTEKFKICYLYRLQKKNTIEEKYELSEVQRLAFRNIRSWKNKSYIRKKF